MGIIKKIFGKELIGWSQDAETEIYPITHVGAVYDDSNTPLTNLLKSINQRIDNVDGTIQRSAINYLWAFTVATSDEQAASNLNVDEMADVPTNYYQSSALEVEEGQYIYMTTARKQGNAYLVWEDNHIWSTPVRIGTGNTSSTTGNDGNGYNYVYCRTAEDVAPVKPVNLTVENIESIADPTYGISIEGTLSNRQYNVWYDHPLGVDDNYQYEWIAIAQGNDSQGWSAYMGPTLWSKWGVDGKDSEGIEYIFTVVKEEDPTPEFIDHYSGRIGENGAVYQDVPIASCTTNTFYQNDDFIPVGWHDLPQRVTQEYPRQYVSVRKRKFSQGSDPYWDQFSQPVLWAKLAQATYTAQMSTDSVVIGDTDLQAEVQRVSCNTIRVFDGDNEITNKPRKYKIVITATAVNNIDNLFKLSVVDSIVGDVVTTKSITDPSYISGKGFGYDFVVEENISSLGMIFCLTKLDADAELLPDAYGVEFLIKVYDVANLNTPVAEIKKLQAVQVTNKSGVLTRLRGFWEAGNHYCYKTFDGSGTNEKHIVYVDIVEYEGHYYQCTQTHDSLADNAPTSVPGASLWRAADEYEFIATKVLVAETAAIEVLNGGSLVVHNDMGTIVGGLTGGTQAATNDVIIWAGATFENYNNAPFRVYEDGSFVANNAKITGEINANRGTVGGFEINSNSICSVENAYGGTGKFFLFSSGSNTSFLGFSATDVWGGIGLNCLPSATGATAMLRIEHTATGGDYAYFPKWGMYLKVSGGTEGDDISYTNCALYVPAGKYAGFRPVTKRVGATRTLTKLDSFILVVADGVTLNLPSGCEDGQMYYIQPYGKSVTLTASDPDKILKGGSQETSHTISGTELHILLYDRVNKVWSLGWLNT